MFLLLALIFGVGFVAFGVGSDVQGGIADVLGVGAGSGVPSVEEAQEKLDENPGNPTALRELATALQTEGRSEEAISPLEQYTAVRAKDQDALRELAGLYIFTANQARQDYDVAQEQTLFLNPGAAFLPSSSTPLGQALAGQPVVDAATAKANAAVNDAYTRLIAAYSQTKTTYEKLAKLTPNDPAVQLQLGDAAQSSSDATTAIAAYKRFLKLAPDDPNAELVRQQVQQLEAAAKASAADSAG